MSALSERDETADICTDDDGQPEADPELRDTENVPLDEDVDDFFEREVKPHVPDAWVNTAVRIPRTARSARSATRSTSTATSTSTSRRVNWNASRRTSGRWRRTSWRCCRR